MFEKEAEEWVKGNTEIIDDEELGMECIKEPQAKESYLAGAEFGYNKANEWHYVKDGDLPEADNRIVLCVCVNGYIDGKKHYILKLLTRKEFPLFQPIYAWKEIVLPELKESE